MAFGLQPLLRIYPIVFAWQEVGGASRPGNRGISSCCGSGCHSSRKPGKASSTMRRVSFEFLRDSLPLVRHAFKLLALGLLSFERCIPFGRLPDGRDGVAGQAGEDFRRQSVQFPAFIAKLGDVGFRARVGDLGGVGGAARAPRFGPCSARGARSGPLSPMKRRSRSTISLLMSLPLGSWSPKWKMTGRWPFLIQRSRR